MSDENKCAETKEHNCIVKCECFRKFLIVAFGTFVGVYLALSLFAATNKPPIESFDNKLQPQVVINQVQPEPPAGIDNPFKEPGRFERRQEK